MYKEVTVFNTDKLKCGVPIKLKKRGLSNDWVYGIVQNCSYETLYYVTIEPPKHVPQEKFLHLNDAVRYGYTIEILDEPKTNTMMNTESNIYPVFMHDIEENTLEIKIFYSESQRREFVDKNGSANWKIVNKVSVEVNR
jgi:hypothetical protein